MRRFSAVVAGYLLVCLVAMVVIVLRGDGPHPRILALYPPNGDRYFPGGTVEIAFSQPMDTSSVQRALQVSPGGEGQGAWYGNILNLQPVGDWKPNVTYHLELTGSVTDAEGRPLRTPVAFWFRVHHVHRLDFCRVNQVRNVCEPLGRHQRPITRSPTPVLQYALSGDGSTLAYIRRDRSGLPHLFVINADGTGNLQLTSGSTYADSDPSWEQDNTNQIDYQRRRVLAWSPHLELGKAKPWSVQTDGSANAPY